jgi:hypothetical protein
MSFSISKVFGKKLSKKSAILRITIIIVIAGGLAGIGSSAYALFHMPHQQVPHPISKSPAKLLESTHVSQQPAANAEPSQPDTPTPDAAQPSPTKPGVAPKVSPAPKTKTGCDQKIAALRVDFDAKSRAIVAEHQENLAILLQAYNEGEYSDPSLGFDAYMQDRSDENTWYMQQGNENYAEFTQKINAIGCGL